MLTDNHYTTISAFALRHRSQSTLSNMYTYSPVTRGCPLVVSAYAKYLRIQWPIRNLLQRTKSAGMLCER